MRAHVYVCVCVCVNYRITKKDLPFNILFTTKIFAFIYIVTMCHCKNLYRKTGVCLIKAF